MNQLLTIENLKDIDSQSMYEIYDKWSDRAKESYKNLLPKIDLKNIEHVVFAGMGGSGAIGDVFASILSKKDIHVTVVKGYLLPKTVNENTLVVCTSISGNTDETLTVLQNSKKSDAKFVGLSSGGLMEDYCEKNSVDYYKIEKEHSPRASFIGFLYSTLNILEPIIPISKNEIGESIISLSHTKKEIDSNNLNERNSSLELASWIKSIPIIYYPWGLQSAAIRFKNSMQENAKKHVLFEDIIEACHNGIVSWEKDSNMQPILIQGYDDYVKTKERWRILKEFFNLKQIEYKEVSSVKGSIISKIINLIYLFDYTSIYHSVIAGIDPSPVTAIDFIKERLSKW